MDYLLALLEAGIFALTDYLSAHVLTCLVPAFFIAGAIQVFLSKETVLKFLGPKSPKVLSYAVASISGTVLAVCSCTVIPVFAGIYKRGAGIGPASAFLYSGPAINILAIIYTAAALGPDIGLTRAIGAISFSIFIGIVMAVVFRKSEPARTDGFIIMETEKAAPGTIIKQLMLFVSLIAVLIFGAATNWIPAGISLAAVIILAVFVLDRQQVKEWLLETWHFAYTIAPWLLIGVFGAGIFTKLVPNEWVGMLVGANTIQANLIAAGFGAIMYFPTLAEVPVTQALMQMGMDRGPVITLLLADPALSLPSILAITAIMGKSRTIVYTALVVVVSSIIGLLYGILSIGG